MIYTLVEFLVGLQFEGLLGVVGHYPGGGHEFSFGIVDKATLAERYTDGNEGKRWHFEELDSDLDCITD
jgi:hypothetical protein